MFLSHYLLFLAILVRFASSLKSCHACLEGICYSKTPILNGYQFSGQLAVDRTDNIVYFHYKDVQETDFTASFDLDDIRFKIIPNIDFSFARAVDQSSRNVYIGGAKGMYKYNAKTNDTVEYALLDKTIWHMQFKNKIYYTLFDTKGLYTLENKRTKSVAALSNYTIDDFVIDSRGDIYFLSESNVHVLKKGANRASVMAADIYSLSVDRFGTAHFVHASKRGLYKLDSKTGELYEVGAFGNGLPLKSVFDNNNNIVYHENNSRKLYYLMPNYGRCMVSKRSHGLAKPQERSEENEEEMVILRIS